MKGYTIQNSIELLEKGENGSGGSTTATNVSYDNTSSGLTADDVQEAIDELDAGIKSIDTRTIYSKTETVIGKWIDDRDVYRKCVVLDSAVSVSNSTFTSTGMTINDADIITNGVFIRIGNKAPVSCDFDLGSGGVVQVRQHTPIATLEFAIGSIIIVEYVKTVPTISNKSKKTKKEE